jgi:hypothetical protein
MKHFEPAAASFAARRSAVTGDPRWRGHHQALRRSVGGHLSMFAESERVLLKVDIRRYDLEVVEGAARVRYCACGAR